MPNLRERLVEIIMDAAGWKRGKQGAGIIADALLESEEWQALEAVAEAVRKCLDDPGLLGLHTDEPDCTACLTRVRLLAGLARLDAGKEEGR